MKRLLNRYEEATNRRLRPVCEEWGTHVFIKVRLADVLPIENSGLSNGLFRFALQSHFDFVVCDDHIDPLFAVEYDGHSHSTDTQKRRDRRKNELCSRFDFPLLRVNSRYLRKYGDLDLLGWFIHSWFAGQAMEDAQEVGFIARDETIDPTSVLTLPGEKGHFPLWLTKDVNEHVRRLSDEKKTYDPGISSIVGRDSVRNYRAIGYVRVTPQTAIFSTTAMQNQLFPVDLASVIHHIVVRETYEKLLAVLRGEEEALPCDSVQSVVRNFSDSYEIRARSQIMRGPAE